MHTFNYIDASIPSGMTIAEYRRARPVGTPRRRRRLRLRLNLRIAARQTTAATA
jgi:hypothetical protein